jgi:TonB family protein
MFRRTFEMNQVIGERPHGLRRFGRILFQACALALVIGMASPARAADDRAVKSRVAPVYPEIAKRMKIEGAVKVQATVDATGKVTDAKAVNGNRILCAAAEDAVRKWRFDAASGDSQVNVEVNFTLGQ